jgi:flagellin
MKVNNSSNIINNINNHNKNATNELNKISNSKKLQIGDASLNQIAQALMSDASIMSQGIQNGNESVAMLQIADGTLQEISKITSDLEALQTRANSASLNNDQKAMLQKEFDTQVNAINDMINNTSYNNQSLFGKNFTTSLGDNDINLSIPDFDTSNLSLTNSDSLKSFRESINNAFSEIGSGINALSSSMNSLLTNRTSTLSAYSQIADTDIAQSVNEFDKEKLMQQASSFALAQQNSINSDSVYFLTS